MATHYGFARMVQNKRWSGNGGCHWHPFAYPVDMDKATGKHIAATFAAALLGFVATPEIARLWHGGAFAQSAQSTTPPSSVPQTIAPNAPSITTFGQSGGNNTIIYNGERIPKLTDVEVEQIRKAIPSGAEITILKLNSDAASLGVEDQLRKALTGLGYKCCNPGIAFTMQPFRGIKLSKLGDTYAITIGDVRLE